MKERLYGFYRAKVTEVNIDQNRYGAIRVFIPDIMDKDTVKSVDKSFSENRSGIVAYPANTPLGGYDLMSPGSYYCNSVYVPPKDSYVWIFFEGGDPSKPFYFSAFKYRVAMLPPEHIGVADPSKVYTIIKSTEGRSIIVSDSSDHARVEITGKRRKLPLPPSGNPLSSYETKDNMTVILIEETEGKEQVLIETYQGDHIKLSIEDRTLEIDVEKGIDIKSKGSINIQSEDTINIQAVNDVYITSLKGSVEITNSKGGIELSSDGCNINMQGKCNINSNDEMSISAKKATLNGDTDIKGQLTLSQDYQVSSDSSIPVSDEGSGGGSGGGQGGGGGGLGGGMGGGGA